MSKIDLNEFLENKGHVVIRDEESIQAVVTSLKNADVFSVFSQINRDVDENHAVYWLMELIGVPYEEYSFTFNDVIRYFKYRWEKKTNNLFSIKVISRSDFAELRTFCAVMSYPTEGYEDYLRQKGLI